MRQHTLRQVLFACINSRRAICAVQGDGLCFAISGNNNLLGCTCQGKLCDCAICGLPWTAPLLRPYRQQLRLPYSYHSHWQRPEAAMRPYRWSAPLLVFHLRFYLRLRCRRHEPPPEEEPPPPPPEGFFVLVLVVLSVFAVSSVFCFCFILRGIRRRIMLSHAMQKLCKFFSCYLLCGAKGSYPHSLTHSPVQSLRRLPPLPSC